MTRLRTYLLGVSLTLASLGAMVWSAVKPGTGPGADVVIRSQDALSNVRDWFRRGPADGTPDWEDAAYTVHAADARRGAGWMVLHGCGSCHEIPGISGARGSVGPSLDGFRHRAYVAGILPNEPGALVRWLVDPTVHAPQTAMPDLGLSENEARDMAAYLYTLRGR